ncbi:hypothetical protein BS47DRAFT_1369638 [Hydnum rufescens UP504]|uniref:F-box domain-containing protein n=1 Tax=Hydnum rufescens UP504 TaxID=1448309 RepID=A0A9P6AC97_9AGAM|nr:hypothetical protein BS47DRAFT_1369638 [Hydnum rufescens UP504]
MALGMAPILALIFSWCGASTLAASACVARHWGETALRVLWREVDSNQAMHLFRVLWPEFLPSNGMSGHRVRGNWDRFIYYSSRIRKLALPVTSLDEMSLGNRVGCDILNDVNLFAFTRGRNLFPLLTALKLDICGSASLTAALWLLHPNIREISLIIHEASDQHIILALETIALRCPDLRDMEMHLGYSDMEPDKDIEMMCTELSGLITSLSHLESLRLAPNMLLNPRVWSAASAKPGLRSLRYVKNDEGGETFESHQVSPPMQVVRFRPEMFQSLLHLSLSTRFLVAFLLFGLPPTPPALQQLELDLSGAAPPDDLQPFLQDLVTNAPLLSEISISLCAASPHPRMVDIQPLFTHRIQRLRIQLDLSLDFDNADLSHLAQASPNIIELSLAPDPISSPLSVPPKLTLDALPILARFCPKIQILGLYIDTASGSQTPSTFVEYTFKHLELLNIGLHRARIRPRQRCEFAL